MVVHGDKLRWLFWLRLRMLTRGFRRSRASLIGSIIFLLFVLVGAGFAAYGSFAAYHYLSAPANFEVLYLVLTGLLLLWIVLPLMEFASNEGLDLSKLQLFPLTHADIANTMGRSEGAVRMLYLRALRRLRELYLPKR